MDIKIIEDPNLEGIRNNKMKLKFIINPTQVTYRIVQSILLHMV
jgi:hypothetical protein